MYLCTPDKRVILFCEIGNLVLQQLKARLPVMHSLPTLFDELTSRIEVMRAGNETPHAVPTGISDLDRVLYGFQQGKLYVIAGRPGAGTTAFMINLVHNMLLQSKPAKKVAVFSLDLSSRVILEKLLACTTEIWLEKIIRGKLEDHEWEKLQQQGINRILASPLSLEDRAAMSVTEIAEKCEELINSNRLDILFIDNLQQIIKEKGQNPDEEIVKTMRSLRDLARTRNIPIVVLSRWNPSEENKPGRKRKPQLSDIQDTGIIGQEADALLFLYRPEYFDITEDESGESLRGVTYIKIAKNRMGSLDTIRMKALLHIQKFEDYIYDAPFTYKEPAERTRRSNKKAKQNGTLFDKEIPDEPL
jgi:replicative DNA helicase